MIGVLTQAFLFVRFPLFAIGAAFLLLTAVFPVPAFAQASSPKQLAPAAIPDSQQLNETIAKDEQLLASPPAGITRAALVEARTQLATAYFLLHRYGESLTTLRPLRSAETTPIPAQAWSVQGLDELELNQLPEAINSLRHALQENPSSATTRLALGDALARSNRFEEAAKEYERQTKLTSSLPDAWYKLGLAHSQISAKLAQAKVRPQEQGVEQQLIGEELIAKGDNLNAARLLFRVLRRSPKQPDVHADLGVALLALGYAKAAQDQFRQALTDDPESPSAKLGLAETAALSGDWNEVKKRMEDLSRSEPFEVTRLVQFPPAGLIVDAWNRSRLTPPETFATSDVGKLWQAWVGGSEIVERIIPEDSEHASNTCSENKLSTPDSLGLWQTESCYEVLEKRLHILKQPSLADKTKLAEAEYRLGHYQAALRTAGQLHALDARSGWGIYWLSKAHDALAEECFLKVGALNPNSARVHQMLAEHYMKLSDYTKARTEYESAIRLAPESPELHLGLGTVLSRTSNWKEAESELKKTLELVPESDFAHYQLGHAYVQQSLWQPAIEQLRQVPANSTELLSARLDLSQAEAETGETATAVQDLLSVAGLDHDGEVYFRLAPLYRKLGDEAQAREAIEKFKQMRAASLAADKDELGALENEQAPALSNSP
jgi:tetratricopeptide (TPR) repeat protein